MQQMNIFEVLNEPYKITKPIRLIECFAGYGSQNLALKYLGANYKHHKICEWATKSIQAYNDLHIQDYTDYSKDLEYEEIVGYLFKKGISLNYNEPMTLEQIKRKGESWCRTTFNNIIATHNLVNIQQVHGRDLDITDTDSFTYLLTYSFPCQDLSLAGKGKGMAKDSGTRSGMLWEVERILNECAELGTLPQVHSKDNMPHFQAWIKALEKLGYSSYWQDLNAKDYGIPQNRDRTFMVSMLGDWYYEFPKKKPLKLRLKDMLEDNVDEKYYISYKLLNYYDSKIKEGWRKELTINPNCCSTICNPGRNQVNDTFILDRCVQIGVLCGGKWDKINESCRRVYSIESLSPTIHTCSGGNTEPKIAENNGEPICLNSKGGRNGVDGLQPSLQDRVYSSSSSVAITTGFHPSYTDKEELRIRKLTPRECGRLMNVKDEDIDKMAKNQSDSSLYHLFGDSIVVNVLMAIFGELIK